MVDMIERPCKKERMPACGLVLSRLGNFQPCCEKGAPQSDELASPFEVASENISLDVGWAMVREQAGTDPVIASRKHSCMYSPTALTALRAKPGSSPVRNASCGPQGPLPLAHGRRPHPLLLPAVLS